MAVLARLAVLLLGPASALQIQGPIADAAAAKLAFWQGTAKDNVDAWQRLGNYTSLVDLKVGDPIPALQGCYGFECVEKYVKFDDGSFTWGVRGEPEPGETNGVRYNIVYVTLSSQAWMAKESGKNAWYHSLAVIVPESLTTKSKQAGHAIVFIEKGLHPKTAVEMATRTGAMAVVIADVPNKVNFPMMGKTDMHEEDLKAWSWHQFASDASHPEWPIEMPDVKAVVRAMDATVALTKEAGALTNMPKVDRFILTGHSKRGMAAWMAGAVDRRVEAIIPLDISLNLQGSGEEQVQDYGGIPPRALPYRNEGALNMTLEQKNRSFAIIDPLNYISRLTMPKMAMFAGKDEFFPPDVTRTWWGSVPDPKTLYVFGNSWHRPFDLEGERGNPMNKYFDTAEAFVSGLLLGKPIPEIKWTIDSKTGAINVKQVSEHTPTSVKLWSAQTAGGSRRDFRSATWKETGDLSPLSNGDGLAWGASIPAQGSRWIGFYIAFEYEAPRPGGSPIRMTTEVSVVPNTRPFPNASLEDPKWQTVVEPDEYYDTTR